MITLVLIAIAATQPAVREGPAPVVMRGADIDMDARADAKRDEAIDKLKRLLPGVSEGPQKAELVFRLSEMYWAKSKYARLRAMQSWDQSLEHWNKIGKRGEAPTLEHEPQSVESASYRSEALKLYQRILTQYPMYERRDEVLYSLGSAQYDSGEAKLGVETFWQLIKEYPDSLFTADAWLQLGEHFFNTGKVAQAVKAYDAAAATKRPRVYAYATYKLAWCDFNLQDYRGSLDKFHAVVEYAKAQHDTEFAEADRLQLLDEALSDMVRAYARMDALDEAFSYYQSEVAPAKARQYLRKLAKRYDEEGKYLTAIKAFQRLNNEDADAADAPANQVAIVSAYAQLGRSDDVRREVRRLIDQYSPGSVWAQHNSANPQAMDAANSIVESELAKLCTEQHRAAQQTKLTDAYALARDLYGEYLQKFPTSVNTNKFRFFFAEISFELKDFARAAEQYSAVVTAEPKGELAKPAAYTAILAWDKVVSGTKETVGDHITTGKSGKGRGEIAKEVKTPAKAATLSPARERLIEACDAFVNVAPNDEEVVKVRFKAASQYYAAERYDEAAERFSVIIAKHPKDPLARPSAEAILTSYATRKDWPQLAKNARAIAQNRDLMGDKAFADRVNDFVQAAGFNEILYVIEPNGDAKATAEAYAGFVKEFPKSKYAMTARYNAMLAYDKAHDTQAALAIGAPALNDTGENEARSKIALLTADLHERVAELSSAAKVLERLGSHDGEIMLRAGSDREAASEYDEAFADYKAAAEALKAASKDSRGADVALRAGKVAEKRGDAKAAFAFYDAFAANYAPGDAGRQFCADYAAAKLAKDAGAKPRVPLDAIPAAYSRLTAKERERPCAKAGAAAAAFANVEADYQAAMAITLTGAEKEVTQKLVKKLERVDAAQKRYTQVLAMGEGTWGIAGLYRIGTLYQNLSKAMFDSPCPKRLDGDQCAIYRQALGDKAFPLEERAIEAFDKAMNKAYELGIYDEWLTRSQEALKTYEPQRFPETAPLSPPVDPALSPPGGAS